MTKRQTNLKLPDDFLGIVAALLNTPPPPKGKRKAKKTRKRSNQRATKRQP